MKAWGVAPVRVIPWDKGWECECECEKKSKVRVLENENQIALCTGCAKRYRKGAQILRENGDNSEALNR